MSGVSDWWTRLRDPAGTSLATRAPARQQSSDATAALEISAEDVKKLVDELREAVRRAGILRDDPMMPLMTGFARAIHFMADRGAASDHVVTRAGDRITEAILSARHSADAEARRFQESIRSAEAETVRDISNAIARSADRALTRRIAVFDRNTALIAAGLLFTVAAACLGGGYWWGSSNASADIQETEYHLQAAFKDGGDAANIWFGLMSWNDIREALSGCRKPGQALPDPRGRACLVPLWLQEPVRQTPIPP